MNKNGREKGEKLKKTDQTKGENEKRGSKFIKRIENLRKGGM